MLLIFPYPASLDVKIPMGDPCHYSAEILLPCLFLLDKSRCVMLKAGAGDALVSSLSLCAKLVVQNSKNTFCLPVLSCLGG